jgi:two-component system NtrC family response regulator
MEPELSKRAPLATSLGPSTVKLVDVVEEGGRLYVTVEFPGGSAGEVDIRLLDGLLDICAEREALPAWLSHNDDHHSGVIVGCSRPLTDSLTRLHDAAADDANVLLCGETGTGKELFARVLHEKSARARGNFVAVDCTVLPETLAGSLLFGHDKGSFAGADRTCARLVRQAHCGTLFLDEVGELSPTLQQALLRILQERRFRPIGGHAEAVSDFRLVAATNRDLQRSVARGLFHEDLLSSLQPCRIELPALRHRIDDIPLLADYHVERLCRRYGFPAKQMTPEFIRALVLYPWPGNVRELISALEQALLAAPLVVTLFARHLPQHIRIQVARSALEAQRGGGSGKLSGAPAAGCLPRLHDLRSVVFDLAEKQYLASLVQLAGPDVSQACRLSGLSRSRLYTLLKKHSITLH